MKKFVKYFYPKQETGYFNKLKTDFYIIQVFLLIPGFMFFLAQDLISPNENFAFSFYPKIIICLYLFVSLFIVKYKGIKIAGNIFSVIIILITIGPINILSEDTPIMYKYVYGFYSVFAAFAYGVLFANRTILLINAGLIFVTTTHIYLFSITRLSENTIFLKGGYFNHTLVLISVTVILFFIHKFTELAINKANSETENQKQQNKDLLIAQEKVKTSGAELIKQNEELDKKVEKRTKELQLQNQEYVALNEEYKTTNEELAYAIEKVEISKAQLQLITNNFVDGMIYQVAMLDENKRKFTYISNSVYDLYGCSPNEAKENPDLIYGKVHKDDIPILIKKEKDALKKMSVFKAEIRVINTDGSIRWSYLISQPKVIKGIVCWDGIEIDITERKKMELELKESAKELRASNKTKDKFFSIIAHDLKSPFNSILGFAELLSENFDNFDKDEQKKFIDIMNVSIQNTYKLLDNLLLWSRAQQGNIKFMPENLNLYLLCTGTIQFLAQSAESKSINIINKIHENTHIDADKDMLSTIMRNLISNAIKFTPKEGTVEIGVETRRGVSLHEIYVKDSGVGISKKILPKLFDIGEHTSTKGTESEKGTGLGLILCKEFIEKHGGKIWVESDIGKGSKFIFTLPVDL
ncbi:MAG: hypothetical protein B6I20_09720 [Bacteroidetes bacterium 4572_117]|nr:MAG: hypothetical protein B6I20_09720 [Bacteroidetes bacterium 4572_117]